MQLSSLHLWRPAYEAYASLTWFLAAVLCSILVAGNRYPELPLIGAAIIAATIASVRFGQALSVWKYRFWLDGRAPIVISVAEVKKKMDARPGHVWMGYGFEWRRDHTQRLYDLQKCNRDTLRPPCSRLIRRALKLGNPSHGDPILHGLEPREEDQYIPIKDIKGHVFVPAKTGAIKTRLLALLATQAILRQPRETVVILDPKGDKELLDLVREVCRLANREDDFAYFHPAFPKDSVCIDPLANWTRTTEVASRIAALIPSESGVDPWSAFGWRVLYLVVEGCVYTMGERPTLATIRRYVEGGVDQLLHNTIVKQLTEDGIDWRQAIEPYLKNVGKHRRPSPSTPNETVALVEYYKRERQNPARIGPVDGLIQMFEHDHAHAQKMLATLLPVLAMLTAGDLAELLSPNRDNPADTRPILNGATIADSGAVIYVGLDALSDAVVASAISSIFTADLTSYAGARFNSQKFEPNLNVFVDEANEAVNQPFIQMLNKGRGAGYCVIFFSQTFSDFVAKLGSEDRARQVLGNANSTIVGRTTDGMTAQFVMEGFGKTFVNSVASHHGTSTVADGEVLNHVGSYGARGSEELMEVVPQEALAHLPDLEYFASYSGGKIRKGRIPVVIPTV